jgi:hypothetical protein
MAKNVQIVPLSGSIEFQDTVGANVKYAYESGRINVTVGGSDVMYFTSGSNIVGIDNSAKFKIPIRTPSVEDPEGTLSFDTADNALVFGNGGSSVSLQGPLGPKGVQGPKGSIGPRGTLDGNQGPIGPRGTETGVQGPIGAIGPHGPKGRTGPIGNIGPIGTTPGPKGNIGPHGLQGPKGNIGNIGEKGLAAANVSQEPWDAGISYQVGEVTFYSSTDAIYVCILANTGQEPTNGTYWTRLTGEKGVFKVLLALLELEVLLVLEVL